MDYGMRNLPFSLYSPHYVSSLHVLLRTAISQKCSFLNTEMGGGPLISVNILKSPSLFLSALLTTAFIYDLT